MCMIRYVCLCLSMFVYVCHFSRFDCVCVVCVCNAMVSFVSLSSDEWVINHSLFILQWSCGAAIRLCGYALSVSGVLGPLCARLGATSLIQSSV